MTAALESLPGALARSHGTTVVRVGAASIWSVIVLLPLAAIVWQSAKGGWHAFWYLQRGAGLPGHA